MMMLAYWFVLIAGLMPYSVIPIARGRDFDNSRPRDVHETSEGLQKRAYGVHLNSFEVFPLYAVAVLIAVHAGSDATVLNWLAGAWLAFRAAYIVAYLKDMPSVRSALWTTGILIVIAIITMPLWGPYPEGL